MYSLSRKDEQYEDWLKLWLELRLPYSCGRFQKQFQKILSPSTSPEIRKTHLFVKK